ncbi:hypothetical protein NECAME_10813, partial [Necator americanus]
MRFFNLSPLRLFLWKFTVHHRQHTCRIGLQALTTLQAIAGSTQYISPNYTMVDKAQMDETDRIRLQTSPN